MRIPDPLIVESLDAAILVLDQEMVLRKVNVSAETLFGQSRKNMLGQNISTLISLDTVTKYIEECQRDHSQFTIREVVLTLPRQEKLVDITLSSMPTDGTGGSFVLMEL